MFPITCLRRPSDSRVSSRTGRYAPLRGWFPKNIISDCPSRGPVTRPASFAICPLHITIARRHEFGLSQTELQKLWKHLWWLPEENSAQFSVWLCYIQWFRSGLGSRLSCKEISLFLSDDLPFFCSASCPCVMEHHFVLDIRWNAIQEVIQKFLCKTHTGLTPGSPISPIFMRANWFTPFAVVSSHIHLFCGIFFVCVLFAS